MRVQIQKWGNRKPAYTLKKLLAGIDGKNVHKEQDFGQAQGIEVW